MADEELRLILEAVDKNVSVVLSKVNGELDKTGKTASSSGSFVDGFSNELTGMLTPLALGAAAATALGAAFKFSLDMAAESELAQAKLSAVLTATGNAAGLTKDEINRMADELAAVSGVDDELIVNAETVLLTFRSIGKDVFPQATEAALNMSAVMGTDLQSSIVMIGKALNDPIQGVGTLRRVGVQLTDQQEEMVKKAMSVNDTFAAQQIILSELNSEFRGAAEAMGSTYTGEVNKLKIALGDLGSTVGESSIPALTELVIEARDLTKSIDENWVTVQHWIDAWKMANSLVLGQGTVGFQELSYWLGDYDRAANRAALETANYTDWIGRMSAEQVSALPTEAETALALKADADAAKQASDGYKALLGDMEKVSAEEEAYTAKTAELTAQRKQVEQDLALARSQGYWETSDKVQGYQNKLVELDGKIAETAVKHSEAMNKMIYDMTLAKLSVEGLTDAEFAMAQQTGVALGIFSQAEAEQAIKMNELASAVADGRLKVEDLGKAIDMLPSGKSIDVIIQAITTVPGTKPKATKYATGTDGWETVPSGFPNDTYPIALSSGERFAVIPNGAEALPVSSGEKAAGGGATFIFHSHFSPMVSLANEAELEAAMYPAFVAMLNRAKSDGSIK
jgi:hypothetical protein